MKFDTKIAAIPLFVSLALTGCIEVDDDSNDGVVDALNQQNATLTEQNNLLEEQLKNSETSVTMTGVVIDVVTEEPLENATVTVLRGETVLAENVATENGVFTVEGLPASTDLIVVASTEDDSYLSRAYFVSTPAVQSGDGFNDVGRVKLSKPVEVSFTVSDADSGEAIPDLAFSGFSYFGYAGSTISQYAHKATFDAETGTYKVTLPRDLEVTLSASADTDGDGVVEFDSSDSEYVFFTNNRVYISEARSINDVNIVLDSSEAVEPEPLSIVLTLLDDEGNAISGAAFYPEDGDEAISSFDETLGAYTFDIEFDGTYRFRMPSFMVDGKTYSSASVYLGKTIDYDTDTARIYVDTGGYASNCCFSVPYSDELNLVMVARELMIESNVEFITRSFDSATNAYSVYYSEPVTIAPEQVVLSGEIGQIKRGNESADDNVPAGYTYIESSTVTVPVTVTSALGGTKQIFTPAEALENNTTYTYNIGNLTSVSDGVVGDVYGDQYEFTTSDAEDEFDINDLVFDNRNYYSNGGLIVSANTAGVANTASDYPSSVRIVLPASVQNLNFLILNILSYEEYGSENVYNSKRELVLDGDVNMTRHLAIDVAENEEIVNNIYLNLLLGSTAADQTTVYSASTGLYLNDNTASDPVTVTFSYEYQTKSGVNKSGTMTLPVR